MYQALYRKWRPATFADVVGQPQVTETLRRQVAGGRLSHAYLFTGTRGTGKTTCAKLLAKAANCESPQNGEPCNMCRSCTGIDDGSITDVFEIDAASNSGVDNIRTIREQTVYAPVETRLRVYIIDECHMLTGGAFNALLKTLEEPPEHVLFILATTELHKVPATILSRCQRFSFRRLTVRDLTVRLLEIAATEQIPLSEDGAACIARLSDGAARDAISMLDQCSAATQNAPLDQDAVMAALGLAAQQDVLRTAQAVADGDTPAALAALNELYMGGKDAAAFLSELGVLLRDALLLATTKDTSLLSGGFDATQLVQLGMATDRLCDLLTTLSDTQNRLQRSVNKRLDLEICLIEMCVGQSTRQGITAQPVVSQPGASAQPQTTTTPTVADDADDDPPPWNISEHLRAAATVAVQPPQPSIPAAHAVTTPVTRQSDWWKATIEQLNGTMPMSQYMQLGAQPDATLDGDIVYIMVTSPFAKSLLGESKILTMIATAASAVLERPVSCKVRLMDDKPQADIGGNIDDLLRLSEKFDNFEVN